MENCDCNIFILDAYGFFSLFIRFVVYFKMGLKREKYKEKKTRRRNWEQIQMDHDLCWTPFAPKSMLSASLDISKRNEIFNSVMQTHIYTENDSLYYGLCSE